MNEWLTSADHFLKWSKSLLYKGKTEQNIGCLNRSTYFVVSAKGFKNSIASFILSHSSSIISELLHFGCAVVASNPFLILIDLSSIFSFELHRVGTSGSGNRIQAEGMYSVSHSSSYASISPSTSTESSIRKLLSCPSIIAILKIEILRGEALISIDISRI